ncbi:MAG: PD-(D/E)XK nuclease family protein, partial [Pseudomonadota bacterium]
LNLVKQVEKNQQEVSFRHIKVWYQVKKLIKDWQNLSEKNNQFSAFDLSLLEYINQLQLPRTYTITLANDSDVKTPPVTSTIKTPNSIDDPHITKKTILVASGEYQPLRQGGEHYTPSELDFLSALGPVFRQELVYLLTKHRLKEILKTEANFFIEDGLKEQDWGIQELIQECPPQRILELNWPVPALRKIDYLEKIAPIHKKKYGSVSATGLQSYLDCPRLFYYRELDRQLIDARPTTLIVPQQLGSLQHLLIGQYLQENSHWSAERHQQLAIRIFDNYQKDNNLFLAALDGRKALLDILSFTAGPIQELLKLKQLDSELLWRSEMPINGNNCRGNIDLLVEGAEQVFMFDFKRSSFGIPTIKEVRQFEKIQMWFYAIHKPLKKKITLWGHLNLSEMNKSLIWAMDESLASQLQEINFLGLKKINVWGDHWPADLEQYSQLESQILNKIENDQNYFPSPRQNKICPFCPLASLCHRGHLVAGGQI